MLKKITAALGLGFAGFVAWRYVSAEKETYTESNESGIDGFLNVALSVNDDLSGFFMGESLGFTISLAGLAYLKDWEGKHMAGGKHVLYLDAAGFKTIGYGHKVTPDDPDFSSGINETEATRLLAKDLATHEQAVNDYVKVPIHQFMFDALVIFSFNVGKGAFRKSTLLRKLNAGDYEGALKQFSVWVYGGSPKRVINGLVNRRNKEALLFAEGIKRLNDSVTS